MSNNSVQQESNAERQREHATSVEFVSKSERLYKRYHAIRLSTISVKITITIKFFFYLQTTWNMPSASRSSICTTDFSINVDLKLKTELHWNQNMTIASQLCYIEHFSLPLSHLVGA